MSRLRVYKHKPGKASASEWKEELVIERLADDGRGVARRQGKVVFVNDALPGETVLVRSIRQSKRYDEALLLERKVASPERIEPACIHYDNCGGCQLQHLNASSQQAFKSRRFHELITRLSDHIQPAAPILSAPWQYRHRLRLALDRGVLGLKSARSHQIVKIPDCQILRPALQAAVKTLYGHGELLQVLYRGEIALCEGEGGEVACQIQLPKKPTQAVLGRIVEQFPLKLAHIDADGVTLWQRQAGLRYPSAEWTFEPGDFTQVNPEVNEQLLLQITAWLALTTSDVLLDAFSGLGNFSLPLSRSGARVLGVEGEAAMVDRANEAATAGGYERVSFLHANLFQPYKLPPDITKVLLDPPRAGAAQLCETLAHAAVDRVVYISCDPATFERDARVLLAGGFRLEAARWADMFPQTHHMEALALFSRPAESRAG